MTNKKNGISAIYNEVASKTNYYWIMSIEQEKDFDEYTPASYKKKPWVVNFGVSTAKGDLDGDDEKNYLGPAALKKFFNAAYKQHGLKPPKFEFDISHNWNTARAATKEEAEQIASEISYIFRINNIQPMDEDEGKYLPKIPGTDKVVAFTPPRSGR